MRRKIQITWSALEWSGKMQLIFVLFFHSRFEFSLLKGGNRTFNQRVHTLSIYKFPIYLPFLLVVTVIQSMSTVHCTLIVSLIFLFWGTGIFPLISSMGDHHCIPYLGLENHHDLIHQISNTTITAKCNN